MVGSKDAVIEPGPDDMVVDVDVDDIDVDTIRYGRWRDKKDGKFLVPGRISGSDYSGSIVERANHRKWGEEFGDGLGKWWYETRGGHATFGIVVNMATVPGNISEDVANFLNGLQDYGLADEELHSEMENEAQEEAWKNWAERDFLHELQKKFRGHEKLEEILDDVLRDDETLIKLRNLFDEARDVANVYWENEQGDSMYIDMKRIVAKVKEQDVFDLREG